MHYRKKHPSGKPQIRKNSDDWIHPFVDKGSIKQSKYSVVRRARAAREQLKEYFSS